jgi:hypothetical protein
VELKEAAEGLSLGVSMVNQGIGKKERDTLISASTLTLKGGMGYSSMHGRNPDRAGLANGPDMDPQTEGRFTWK